MKISQIASFLLVLAQVRAVVVDVHQVAQVKPPPGIKTVTHKKEANAGYSKGSPLYDKQEGIKNGTKQAIDEPTEATLIAPSTFWGHKLDLYTSLMSVSVYAVFVLAIAYILKSRAEDPLRARAKGEAPKKHPAFIKCGFAYSFFDFGNMGVDWHICLTAWCCPIIQWARTASSSVTPFMSYWKAVALLLTMTVLAPFTYGISGLIMLAIILKRRRELRKEYSHKHEEKRSMVEDIALVFCCPSFLCCQLVQEAREVEFTAPKLPA